VRALPPSPYLADIESEPVGQRQARQRRKPEDRHLKLL
jgi:hypothetical protein